MFALFSPSQIFIILSLEKFKYTSIVSEFKIILFIIIFKSDSLSLLEFSIDNIFLEKVLDNFTSISDISVFVNSDFIS
ncbi:TPA: hypothetical protein DEG21_03275 [Patescibacteria group bacterium]|nr:hypothetical protein [Candidatus Gracilibacteria bacterium]HBY74881.1 hypothetical protein [Candidatus Gracilibacteria bacterium]